MILSKEFYDQCCPTYQKLINELEQKIAELKTQENEEALDDGEISKFFDEIKAAIFNFAENYLTPKEYWDFCAEQTDSYEQRNEINANGYQHFHLNYELNAKCLFTEDGGLDLKLMDYYNFEAVAEGLCVNNERDISYPHNFLKKCFRSFESHTLRLPSIKVIKRYEEMKLLYPKIKAAENDVERWFKLLQEVGDDEFVEDNVEYRLGKNLLDIKLWMLYIEYLEQKGHFEVLLKVYSNYCRFFLEDFDMLKKYKSEKIKYGRVDIHWRNLFDFEREKNFEDFKIQNGEDEIKNIEDEVMHIDHSVDEDAKRQNSVILPLEKQLFTTFYYTYQFQKFSFKEPLMNYILKNANHRLLRSLFQSCKYFFYKKPTPICYRFKVHRQTKFESESLKLSHSYNPDLYVKNTFITGRIDAKCAKDKTYMSKLIPRLSRCEAKYIYLDNQKLTFKEFKFLVSHGQVVKYKMFDGCIKDENNEYVDLEKIMLYFSNIEELRLPEVKCNSNTAHVLSNQCFSGKINEFCIASISGEPFDPNEFLKFCVKNRDEKIFWRMVFDKHFNVDFIKQFKKIITDYKRSCEFSNIEIYLYKSNQIPYF